VAAVRLARARGAVAARDLACIVLAPGVHFLGATVHLGAADSHLLLTSEGEPGAEPTWVSGGALLAPLAWSPYNVSADGAANIWVATLPAAIPVTRMPALNSLEPLTRLTNSAFPNYDPETQSLEGEVQAPWGGGGAVVEWHKPGLYPRPRVFWKSLAGLKNDSTMDCYNHFSTGSGGPCAHWKGRGSCVAALAAGGAARRPRRARPAHVAPAPPAPARLAAAIRTTTAATPLTAAGSRWTRTWRRAGSCCSPSR
jgi:hypothetical protein